MADRLAGGFDAPEDLLIVGLDDFEGFGEEQIAELGDLADPERIDAPSDGLIESIMQHGVASPVTVRSVRLGSGSRVRVVIDGRQRVMAARVANEHLAKMRDTNPVLVPYISLSTSDDTTVAISNEFRRVDSILTKAKKASRLLKRGHSKEEVIACFAADDGHKISKSTLANWLGLLKLPPDKLAAIESGEAAPSEFYSKPPKEEKTPKASSGRPSLAHLRELQEMYTASEEEPLEGEAEFLSAFLDFLVSGETSNLKPWPDVKNACRKVMRPATKVGKEIL